MSSLVVPVGPGDHIIGPSGAPVTLVEYGDFECPHCGRAHPIVKEVLRAVGDEIQFVYRHFPLTRIHPRAEPAAEIAELAGQFGKFWEMHDMLFENQDALEGEDLIAYAEALGISGAAAARALTTGQFREKVRADFAGGVRSGVNGTPTFFINGMRYDGSWDLQPLREALDAAVV